MATSRFPNQLYFGSDAATATPNASCLLELVSTTQGLGVPAMTSTQRDAISAPKAGIVIYNTTTGKLNVRVAAAWEAVTSS